MMRMRTERAQFLLDNVDLEMATGMDGVRWEHFQLAHLNDDSDFRIERKSRQVAWSFLSSAEAIANAALEGISSIFVSINLQEAVEKINYAKAVIGATRRAVRPRLARDAATYLMLSNGARLISLPSRPPRGKSRFWVYLDEYGHGQNDREVYKGALPIISKGGKLRMGSSPGGASGMFWEIDTQHSQPYPGYSRSVTPWWHCFSFCINPLEAIRHAPTMATADRVERYGNDRIRAIYANMVVEDFQQEYECIYADESSALFTWADIRAMQDMRMPCYTATCRGDDIGLALERIEQFVQAVERGQIESVFCAGVDIGRTRNATEIFLIGMGRDEALPLRMMITLESCSFNAQESVLAHLLHRVAITYMDIDQNGLGMQLAENMARAYPGRVRPAQFTAISKRHWATTVQMLAQQRRLRIPVDTDLAYQLHSIKKIITPSNNVVYDTEKNERHHADKFWSLALAASAALVPAPADAAPQSGAIGSIRLG